MDTLKLMLFFGLSGIFLIILSQWAAGLLPLEDYVRILPLFPFLTFLLYEWYFRDEGRSVGWFIRLLIALMVILLIIGYRNDFSLILKSF
ncbi:MAG TPA: hypothetical protein VLJ10_03425 [Candidatus Bathyarchaeia archaeon]|nr:hypothetical protein [Candidatus Bathyarchaeia archaeon]